MAKVHDLIIKDLTPSGFKCTADNIRNVSASDVALIPVINQGLPSSVNSVMSALSGVGWLSHLSAIASTAGGLTAVQVYAAVALAVSDAGISSGMTWNWTSQMVNAIGTIQANYGVQQGVYITVEVSWEKCENTTTWGLPFTQHLDWVSHSNWIISQAGSSGPAGIGFAHDDQVGVLEAIPNAVASALGSNTY